MRKCVPYHPIRSASRVEEGYRRVELAANRAAAGNVFHSAFNRVRSLLNVWPSKSTTQHRVPFRDSVSGDPTGFPTRQTLGHGGLALDPPPLKRPHQMPLNSISSVLPALTAYLDRKGVCHFSTRASVTSRPPLYLFLALGGFEVYTRFRPGGAGILPLACHFMCFSRERSFSSIT